MTRRPVIITQLTKSSTGRPGQWWIVSIAAGPFRTEAGAARWIEQHKLEFRISEITRKTEPADSGT